MKTYILTSWYFNPLHPGHIDLFELSKELWDELWVIVNNDTQAELKRWRPSFQDEHFRMRVVWAVKPVDKVVLSIDDYRFENGEIPVIKSIEKTAQVIRKIDPKAKIIFAKWGDRTKDMDNIPEADICKQYNIQLIDGMGEKTHHSRNYIVLEEDS